MTWTHSGIIVEKKKDNYIVYASEKQELEMFLDENDHLSEYWLDIAKKELRENGFYKVMIGYGGFVDPIWYGAIRIADAGWEDFVAKCK